MAAVRAGYFGPEGTFTHEALLAASHGGEGLELVAFPTIYDTVMAVHEGRRQPGAGPDRELPGGVGQRHPGRLGRRHPGRGHPRRGRAPDPSLPDRAHRSGAERDPGRRLPSPGQRAVRALHPQPPAGSRGDGRQLDRRGGADRRRPRRPVGSAGDQRRRRALRLRGAAGRRRGRARQRDPVRLAGPDRRAARRSRRRRDPDRMRRSRPRSYSGAPRARRHPGGWSPAWASSPAGAST